MRDLAILLVHLIATIAKLMGPGGVRSIAAIVETKRRNPRWGCRRIAQQLSIAFVIDIDKDVEACTNCPRPPKRQFATDTSAGSWSLIVFQLESVVASSISA